MRGRHPFAGRSGRSTSVLAAGILSLALLIVVAGPGRQSPAELQGPGAVERQVAYTVRALLERDHLLERKVDDTISQRAMATFLKQLDPLKLYFYQSDIDRFMTNEFQLDDQFQRGDLHFAYEVYETFLKRVDERLETVNGLLDGSFDFTKDEELITEPDERHYPANPDEARDMWRKRLKYDLLILRAEREDASESAEDDAADSDQPDAAQEGSAAKSTDQEDPRDRLRRRYADFSRRMHHATDDDLMERYLTAITSSYDPHTNYMSKSTLEDFQISMRLNLDGIGAALKSEDGYIIIDRVLPGGAAAKHGKLKARDQIVSVGEGVDGEMVDVVNFGLKEVVNLIRGKAGTVVRLGVKPAGSNEVQVYEITRARIELHDEEAQAQTFEAGKKADGTPYKVGVIDLPSFYMDMEGAQRGLANYKSTTRDVAGLLDEFKEEGVDIVVLDLRQNGGGSLTEAVNLTGLFIDQGPVVQVKDSSDRIQKYNDTRPGMSWTGPLIVLTSKFSASASEILAGAIQDYGRGLVVGDSTTHGKGTVQHLLDLSGQLFPGIPNSPNLGALKITIQKFYRPSGKSTQLRGVAADIVLPSITDHMEDITESDLDYAIEFDTVPAAGVDRLDLVNEQMIQQLIRRSDERRGKSKDFQDLLRNVQRYREQKDRNRIPLNEEAFMAMRKEFDASEEDERQIEQQVNPGDGGIQRDFYLDEVLEIATDYVQLLQEDHKLVQAVGER